MIRSFRLFILLVTRHSPLATLLLLVFALPASAQVTTGTPAFGSFGGGPDVINLANLNAHWTLPVLNKAGRGMAFSYNLTYDSSVWIPYTSNGTTYWVPNTGATWGWTTSMPRGGIQPVLRLQHSPIRAGGTVKYTITIPIRIRIGVTSTVSVRSIPFLAPRHRLLPPTVQEMVGLPVSPLPPATPRVTASP